MASNVKEMISKQEAARDRLSEVQADNAVPIEAGKALERLKKTNDWNILFDYITKYESVRVTLLRASRSADEVLKNQLNDKLTMIGEFNELILNIPNIRRMAESEIAELEQFITDIEANITAEAKK